MATVSFLFIYVSPVSSSFFTEISKCAQRVSCPPRLKCEYSKPGLTRGTRWGAPKGPWVLSQLFCLIISCPQRSGRPRKLLNSSGHFSGNVRVYGVFLVDCGSEPHMSKGGIPRGKKLTTFKEIFFFPPSEEKK